MKTIQAVRLGNPEVLEYQTIADPTPGPDQVLIEVMGASVNYADIKARSGAYHLGKKPPYIPGLDVAGVVLEVGNEVKGIQPGERVIAFPASGSYAELTLASQELTFVIPDKTDMMSAAAAALVAGTATHMLRSIACISAGESLLVHGAAGGVGSLAIQVARALGVSRVIGSIGSSWKEEHVREMGADEIVHYTSDGYAQDINKLTGGSGVDVILNPLGGATLEKDLECLAPFGRLITFGDLIGGPSRIPSQELYTSNRSIVGCSFGHYRRFKPHLVRETMHTVIDLLANNRIQVPVGKSLRLEDAATAHRHLENREIVGKVILVPEKYYPDGK